MKKTLGKLAGGLSPPTRLGRFELSHRIKRVVLALLLLPAAALVDSKAPSANDPLKGKKLEGLKDSIEAKAASAPNIKIVAEVLTCEQVAGKQRCSFRITLGKTGPYPLPTVITVRVIGKILSQDELGYFPYPTCELGGAGDLVGGGAMYFCYFDNVTSATYDPYAPNVTIDPATSSVSGFVTVQADDEACEVWIEAGRGFTWMTAQDWYKGWPSTETHWAQSTPQNPTTVQYQPTIATDLSDDQVVVIGGNCGCPPGWVRESFTDLAQGLVNAQCRCRHRGCQAQCTGDLAWDGKECRCPPGMDVRPEPIVQSDGSQSMCMSVCPRGSHWNPRKGHCDTAQEKGPSATAPCPAGWQWTGERCERRGVDVTLAPLPPPGGPTAGPARHYPAGPTTPPQVAGRVPGAPVPLVPVQPTCGRGQLLLRGTCRCPVGSAWNGQSCRARLCPAGSKGLYPYCRQIAAAPAARACPTGTYGRPPNCRRLASQRVPGFKPPQKQPQVPR